MSVHLGVVKLYITTCRRGTLSSLHIHMNTSLDPKCISIDKTLQHHERQRENGDAALFGPCAGEFILTTAEAKVISA